jgi:hypothetical protein
MKDFNDSTIKPITQADLDMFIGTETWYRHPIIKRAMWTEGVQFLITNAQCYWLADEIVFAQNLWTVRREPFQEWKLTRDRDAAVLRTSAVLSCEDGNGNRVYTKRIEFTTFPLAEVRLWFTGNVLMLPSEY